MVLEGLSGAVDCVYEAGGTPVEFAPYSLDVIKKEFQSQRVDGLVLTGGGDVDPSHYGEGKARHVQTYGVNQLRDVVEFAALRMARKHNVPVLGICRGAQVINVESGGSLWQNITDNHRTSSAHKCGNLPVNIRQGSYLQEAVGGRRRAADTIHLHHQAVRRVGRGLRASAHHRDGTIEAIESITGRWVVGVQFHPEMARDGAPEIGLFRQLVLHAAADAGLPVPEEREAKAYAYTSYTPGNHYEWPGVMGRERSYEDSYDAYGEDWERAYTPVAPGSHRSDYTEVSWDDHYWCHICRMDFDYQNDYVDHMGVIHSMRVALLPDRGSEDSRAAVLTRMPTASNDYNPDDDDNVIEQVQRERLAITVGATSGHKVG
jgi:putative glutamine amidotransferase